MRWAQLRDLSELSQAKLWLLLLRWVGIHGIVGATASIKRKCFRLLMLWWTKAWLIMAGLMSTTMWVGREYAEASTTQSRQIRIILTVQVLLMKDMRLV